MQLRHTATTVVVAAMLVVGGCGSAASTPSAERPSIATTTTESTDTAPAATTTAPTASATESTATAPAASDTAPTASESVEVNDAWAREPAPGQTAMAVYARVSNSGARATRLSGVTADEAPIAELHETTMDNGVASMQARPQGFEIAPGETFLLEPGGAHVMLRDVDPQALGETLVVTFAFDDGTALAVDVEVRPLSDDTEHEHEHDHDHDEHDHGDDDTAEHDHDHSDHDEHDHDTADNAEHDHGEAAGYEFDILALHTVDYELRTGVFKPDEQRDAIATYVDEMEAIESSLSDLEITLLDLLRQLEAAIEAGDEALASDLAKEAHGIGHELAHHH